MALIFLTLRMPVQTVKWRAFSISLIQDSKVSNLELICRIITKRVKLIRVALMASWNLILLITITPPVYMSGACLGNIHYIVYISNHHHLTCLYMLYIRECKSRGGGEHPPIAPTCYHYYTYRGCPYRPSVIATQALRQHIPLKSNWYEEINTNFILFTHTSNLLVRKEWVKGIYISKGFAIIKQSEKLRKLLTGIFDP